MNAVRYLTDEELVERGVRALLNALGPVESLRFMNLPRERRLESVKRHYRWQSSLDPQQLFDQVFGAEPVQKSVAT